MLRAIAAWFVMLVMGVANGALREIYLLPNLPVWAAYLASGLLLCVLVLAVAILFARWLRLETDSLALEVGAVWLVLTLVFEFGIGLMLGHSWERMFAAYKFEDGSIWTVVVIVIFFAPLIAARIRRIVTTA